MVPQKYGRNSHIQTKLALYAFFCYSLEHGMDFGPIGERCVCIGAQLDFVPPGLKRKINIRYFSLKQKVEKLLLSPFGN